MWKSLGEAETRPAKVQGATTTLPHCFAHAFGPPLFVHLTRGDRPAQAVSLVRAEQSGVWHRHADGTVREREVATAPAGYDRVRLAKALAGIDTDERGWAGFFAAHRLAPVRITYEALTAAPGPVLAGLLTALGRDPAAADRVEPATARLADATSATWAAQFRAEQ